MGLHVLLVWQLFFFPKKSFILHILSSWDIKLETRHTWALVPLSRAAALLKLASGSEGLESPTLCGSCWSSEDQPLETQPAHFNYGKPRMLH